MINFILSFLIMGSFASIASAQVTRYGYDVRVREVAKPISRHDEAAGLTYFNFYQGMDHMVKRLEVLSAPQGQPMSIALTDNGSDEPVFFAGQWALPSGFGPTSAYRPGTLSGSCMGACDLPFSRPIPDGAFYIRGFSIEFAEGDQKIQSLRIKWHDSPNPFLQVVAWDAAATSRKFHYVIQYGFMPRSIVHSTVWHQKAAPHGENMIIPRSAPVLPSVLGSFTLFWKNGGHHLKRIGIDLRGRDIVANFHDNQPDDPVVAHIQAVYLRW